MTAAPKSLSQYPYFWVYGGNLLLKLQGRPGEVVVYQYTRKKFAKIPKINGSIVYCIPEIRRKRYTEYPYLSCNIPYNRFKKPLYTVYPKPLADPEVRGNHSQGYYLNPCALVITYSKYTV